MAPPKRAEEAPSASRERPALGRRRWIQAAAGALGGSVVVALGGRSTLTPPSNTAPEASGAPRETEAKEPVTPRGPSFQTKRFSVEQALLIEALVEHILPEDGAPGGVRAGVPAYIEDIVSEVYDEPERETFLKALDALGDEARATSGRSFPECAPPAREAFLAGVIERCRASRAAGEPRCFFRSFLKLCIEGFCQSQLGATQVLQYESVPGAYHGCVSLAEVGRAWATG